MTKQLITIVMVTLLVACANTGNKEAMPETTHSPQTIDEWADTNSFFNDDHEGM